MNTLRTPLIKIGNSRGIRIPKVLLDQLGFGSEVEISIEGGQLLVRPAQKMRQDWGKAFQRMAAQGDDALLDEPVITKWDKEEWEW